MSMHKPIRVKVQSLNKPVVAEWFGFTEEEIDVKPKSGEMSEEELEAIIHRYEKDHKDIKEIPDDYFIGY